MLAIGSIVSAQPANSPLTELSKQYETAINAGDATKIATLFAEDAVYMAPDMPSIRGRMAIQRHHETEFKEGPAPKGTIKPLASEISGDLGYVEGEYSLRTGTALARGKYVLVCKRVNGQWRIQYEIFNRNEPPAAPTPPTPPTAPTPPQE